MHASLADRAGKFRAQSGQALCLGGEAGFLRQGSTIAQGNLDDAGTTWIAAGEGFAKAALPIISPISRLPNAKADVALALGQTGECRRS